MIDPSGAALKAYFADARRWDQDRLAEALRSRRRAWVVAAGATLLASASAIAVASLAPLKTVEPFVVRVDQSTGVVDVMRGLSGESGPIRYEEAIAKYFLGRYVRAREGYLDAAAEEAFRQVAVMSGPSEQRRWAEQFRGSNPDSPQNRFGPEREALITLRAIVFVEEDVASVRFRRLVRAGSEVDQSDWIATLQFGWTRAPLTEADRLLNPLGFQVQSYRVDPEVIR